MALPAWVMLGYWFAMQFFGGLFWSSHEMGGVAVWAHVGGFIAGVLLIKLFARSDYITERLANRWRPSSVMGE
jgi:membrane associated rhomboid family serine protease